MKREVMLLVGWNRSIPTNCDHVLLDVGPHYAPLINDIQAPSWSAGKLCCVHNASVSWTCTSQQRIHNFKTE